MSITSKQRTQYLRKAVRVGATHNTFAMSKGKGKGGWPSTKPGKKSGGGRDNNPPAPKPKPGN